MVNTCQTMQTFCFDILQKIHKLRRKLELNVCLVVVQHLNRLQHLRLPVHSFVDIKTFP